MGRVVVQPHRGKQLRRLVRVRCERGSPEKTRNCELVVIHGVSSHSFDHSSWCACVGTCV